MKSLKVHYMNKYPGGSVDLREDSLDVWDKDGAHVVAMRKNGAGQFVCVSEEMGCLHAHDLAPIPKDARAWKLKDGAIVKAEEYDERVKLAKDYLCSEGKKIQSCKEIGLSKFDEKQRLLK